MKNTIILISVVLSFFSSIAQFVTNNVEGIYEINEIDIHVNGWEHYSDYNRTDFLNTIQVALENEEGGELSKYEHDGIETHMFKHRTSMFYFSSNKLSVFAVDTNNFNVNGITIGSPINDVKNQFNKLYVEPGKLKVYYGYGVLVFEHSNNSITSIHWSTI